jgi:hypothetical protein
MPLLINEHSVNSAQFFEIYHSEKNARVLGEAMSLPTYVVDEVRRQIRDEGLRYVTSDVVLQNKVDFGRQSIKPTRFNTMKTPPATTQLPDFKKGDSKNPLPALPQTQSSNSESTFIASAIPTLQWDIIKIVAAAKTLLLPLVIEKQLKVERFKLKEALNELRENGFILRLLNGKYTISQTGVNKLKSLRTPVTIHKNALDRIKHYGAFPGQLFSTTDKTKDRVTESKRNVSADEKQAIEEMFNEHLTDDIPSSVDEELAQFDSSFALVLSDVPTKIKIIQKVRSRFTGAVGQHLDELEQFLLSKAG